MGDNDELFEETETEQQRAQRLREKYWGTPSSELGRHRDELGRDVFEGKSQEEKLRILQRLQEEKEELARRNAESLAKHRSQRNKEQHRMWHKMISNGLIILSVPVCYMLYSLLTRSHLETDESLFSVAALLFPLIGLWRLTHDDMSYFGFYACLQIAIAFVYISQKLQHTTDFTNGLTFTGKTVGLGLGLGILCAVASVAYQRPTQRLTTPFSTYASSILLVLFAAFHIVRTFINESRRVRAARQGAEKRRARRARRYALLTPTSALTAVRPGVAHNLDQGNITTYNTIR